MAGRGSSALGVGCVLLFALPFAGVGALTAWLALWQTAAWNEARSWVERPAIIESVRLDPEYALESAGLSPREDGPVAVRFRYEFDRRAFVGDRVWLIDDRDTIGSFYRRVYRELDAHRRTGAATVCFVDPDRPERAVLYRSLRPRRLLFLAVFVVLFGGVGFALLGLLIFGRRQTATEPDGAALAPR